MKTLDIDFISDTHIDFWIKEKNVSNKLNILVEEYVKTILKPKGNKVLVIAGDLGHYFVQDTAVLLELKKYYKHLILVRGNHDMYLVSNAQQAKYDKSSSKRVNEMKEFCLNNDIYYLDGDTVNIDGFKFGGVGMWYDLPNIGDIDKWNHVMNDSNLIMEGSTPVRFQYGYGGYYKSSQWDTQGYYLKEVQKLKDLVPQNIDVLVTHISPIIIPDKYLKTEYRGDPNNIFYCSDNLSVIKDIDPEVVIFGHTHSSYDFDLEEQWFVCNPLGYKGERTGNEIQQITLVKY